MTFFKVLETVGACERLSTVVEDIVKCCNRLTLITAMCETCHPSLSQAARASLKNEGSRPIALVCLHTSPELLTTVTVAC